MQQSGRNNYVVLYLSHLHWLNDSRTVVASTRSSVVVGDKMSIKFVYSPYLYLAVAICCLDTNKRVSGETECYKCLGQVLIQTKQNHDRGSGLNLMLKLCKTARI